ncbi:MAG: hypothetical protein IKU91_03830 [Anaerotignum sp.]|nr:hypothetical protein [Anaerotignum sp.]
MMFGKENRDLADMMLNNERAKKFYRDLSKDVQQTITENGQEIRTMSALRHFAKTAGKTQE